MLNEREVLYFSSNHWQYNFSDVVGVVCCVFCFNVYLN